MAVATAPAAAATAAAMAATIIAAAADLTHPDCLRAKRREGSLLFLPDQQIVLSCFSLFQQNLL